MFNFHDRSKAIRVVSKELGIDFTVPKSSLEIPSDLSASLTSEQVNEIKDVLDVYSQAYASHRKAWLPRLNETLREVTDLYAGEGSPAERKLIAMYLNNAIKVIKRADKEDAGFTK